MSPVFVGAFPHEALNVVGCRVTETSLFWDEIVIFQKFQSKSKEKHK